jgi:hypothetical protein
MNLHAQSVNLPLDHWAYDFLERMETKGVLQQIRDGSKPFTRRKVSEFINNIEAFANLHPTVLTSLERDIIERLKGEFYEELKSSPLKIKTKEYEPHFYSWKGDRGSVHFDILMGGDITCRDTYIEKNEKRIYSPYYGGILRASLFGIGIYSNNRIFTEWGSKKYIQNYRPSQGYPINVERDSSRATWDVSESYFTLNLKKINFQMGRDNLRWGPAKSGNLMLSGIGPAFDLIKISADIGNATFTWAHGELRSDFSHKWISAHRIELSMLRGVDIGFHELVVYGKRGIEIAYLNPFIPYLIAEHTLGDRDNVAMGFDFDINKIRNFKLYGEFFIDDLFAPWEIFNDFWGNKLAFSCGGYWVEPLNIDNGSLRFEYTRIDPFVYTHHDSVNILENYDIGLGHFLQPNSDYLFLQGEYRFSLSVSAKLDFSFIRHGQGDRRTSHGEDDVLKKCFLSNIIEYNKKLNVEIEFEILRDTKFYFRAGHIWVKNYNNIYGQNKELNEIMMMLHINW